MSNLPNNESITRPASKRGRVIDSLNNLQRVKSNKRLKHSQRQIYTEILFRRALFFVALVMVILVFGIMLTLIVQSIPSLRKFGAEFIWGTTWNQVTGVFGALPFLLGTLLTSFIALLISIPFSVSVAILLGEYFPKGPLSDLLKNAVELIASVPSVIYGFWGFAVLKPLISSLEVKMHISEHSGFGIFTASLILAVMIIPYAASLGRSMIQMTPSSLKEAAYSLGATKWEVIKSVIIPYVRSGLFAGILLSLGRALGETMAVTMVIGNATQMPNSIFSTGNTMASVIANELGEATDILHNSALVELGLVLFLVTVVINMIGKKVISRFTNN